MMKVEIWSDFTCPFCYIGKRKFELALENFKQKEYVKVEFKSFQLDPNVNRSAGSVYEMLMKKYDMTLEKVKDMANQICEQGKEVGLHLQFNDMKHANTLDAHRLVKYAEKKGKALQLVDLLYKKYFGENYDIGEQETLMKLANEVGLDEGEVQELLKARKYTRAVALDEDDAAEIGIQGVPFFIINEKYAISGAQPMEVFLEALQVSWNEDKERLLKKQSSAGKCKTSYCVGDECKVE